MHGGAEAGEGSPTWRCIAAPLSVLRAPVIYYRLNKRTVEAVGILMSFLSLSSHKHTVTRSSFQVMSNHIRRI